MKHKKLDKYLADKGLKVKEKTKPTKAFKDLKADEKWALVEQLLRDLKYID